MKARKPNALYKPLIADEKRAGVERREGWTTYGFRKAWISTAWTASAVACSHTGGASVM